MKSSPYELEQESGAQHERKMEKIREVIATKWMSSPKEAATLDQTMDEISRILSS